MGLLKKIKYKKSYKAYSKSLKKSEEALKEILFKNGETPLYFSRSRFSLLLATFGISTKISQAYEQGVSMGNNTKSNLGFSNIVNANMEMLEFNQINEKTITTYDCKSSILDIKNSLDIIKRDGKSILEVNENEIFYAHFPVFHGNIVEMNKKIDSAYVWYGSYRNIELYLCGNSNNVYSVDHKKYPKATWNPSSIEGPTKIFETIVKTVVDENCDYRGICEGSSIFEILNNNIKDTVMNRYGTSKSFYQWQDMLVYCTTIEEVGGIKKIFGVPIFVMPSPKFGYGWYNLNHEGRYGETSEIKYHPNNKDSYYEFDGEKFTGRFLEKVSDDGKIYDVRENKIVMDGNNAYKLNKYLIKKKCEIPDKKKVKMCDDIIGICVEKDLFK